METTAHSRQRGFLVFVVVLGAAAALYIVNSRRASASVLEAAPALAAGKAPADMRAQIDLTVEREVNGIRTEAQLGAYLVRLETRAKHNGTVGALEVEPGIVAINQMGVHKGQAWASKRRDAFTTRMTKLSQELNKKGQ